MAFEAVHRWAHRYAGGRWVALGGGGYEWVDVVPRAWTHLIAEATGHPIDPHAEVPEAFREFVLESLGRQAPGPHDRRPATRGRARSTRGSTPTTPSTPR